MGRPPKHPKLPSVQISAKIDPLLAEQLAALRKANGDTISAQVEDGLRRHIKARQRARRRQSD